jgi:hypothetical protein
MNSRIAVIVWAILFWIFCPARLPAQATNPAYTAEMPSVDRVMKVMQASDPDETAARQMGAFWQLKSLRAVARVLRRYRQKGRGQRPGGNVAV